MPRRSAHAALLALGLLIACGCDHSRGVRAGDGTGAMSISAVGVFGGANVNVNLGVCAGRVRLSGGEATVNDKCFTGDTNVVLCTDATSPNPIKCAPGEGTLAISGTGSDIISYARVR